LCRIWVDLIGSSGLKTEVVIACNNFPHFIGVVFIMDNGVDAWVLRGIVVCFYCRLHTKSCGLGPFALVGSIASVRACVLNVGPYTDHEREVLFFLFFLMIFCHDINIENCFYSYFPSCLSYFCFYNNEHDTFFLKKITHV